MNLILSKYHLTTDLLDEFGFIGKRIIFSTRSATSIMIDEFTYQNLQESKLNQIDVKTLKTLIEKEILIPEEEDEFKYIVDVNTNFKLDENFLSLTIQPSANCQLGCHYCGQVHTKNYANDAVIEKYEERVDHLLNKGKKYDGLSITWYGGEPLTGYNAIKKASQKFISLCKSKGMGYLSDMITNGLSLKPSLFEDLVENCLVTNYQITIDGDAAYHDKRRHTKSGGPTFDIIMQNIVDVTNTKTYNDKNCNITIRVNIDKTNYNSVNSLIVTIRRTPYFFRVQ